MNWTQLLEGQVDEAQPDQAVQFEVVPLADIPMYNADNVKDQGKPETVELLRSVARSADGVVFATPEYNWSVTGAMKNAFGGLLHRNRHWTHAVIHDTIVDLLAIQQDIHPGIFAVMDGTFAGDGPGPRAMRWHEKNILLASADQVAIDAVSAKLQGFDPLNLRFIRKAHELDLGIGDPTQIEIVGYDIKTEPPWNFRREDTFASKGQHMIYHGPLKPLEKVLLQSPIVPWAYFASNFYHNVYWYPFVGRKRVESALNTQWGQLFQSYGDGSVVMPGMEPKTVVQATVGLTIMTMAALGAFYMLRRRK